MFVKVLHITWCLGEGRLAGAGQGWVYRSGDSGGRAPLNDPPPVAAGSAHIASGCPQRHPAQRPHLSLSSRHHSLKKNQKSVTKLTSD